MKKWLIAICSLAIALGTGIALADLNYTQGAGTVIFDFICFATKHCSAHVNIDSTGTEKFTSNNPGSVTVTPSLSVSTSFSSGSVVAGSYALGAFASGSIAAGSFATGSLSFGAGVDGWNQTEGTKADAPWSSGSGSLVALGKAIATNTTSPIPAGTNNIGKIDVLGNTGVAVDGPAGNPATQAITVQGVAGSTQVNVGNYNDPCASTAKSNFAISSSATNTQAVAPSGSTKVYVCSLAVVATSSMAISLVEGTGTGCATTNQKAVIGAITPGIGGIFLTNAANSTIFILGNGSASVAFTATAGNGICIYNSVASSGILSGNLTYVQQ